MILKKVLDNIVQRIKGIKLENQSLNNLISQIKLTLTQHGASSSEIENAKSFLNTISAKLDNAALGNLMRLLKISQLN